MTRHGGPAPITAGYAAIARRFSRGDGLLIGLDFDGTLAPIRPDPATPVITRRCRGILKQLAPRRDTMTAIISGRALTDLRARVNLDEVVYAGNHGLELDWGAGPVLHPFAANHRPELRRILDRLDQRLQNVSGCQIEDKGLTGTVHVRQTPASQVREVREEMRAVMRSAEAPFRLEQGKQVFEIRPDVHWDKGAAVRLLQARTPDTWQTIYLGDDVTDDDAFRTVQPDGFGILVGPPRESEATYHLPTQRAVAPFLEWLVDSCLDTRVKPST